MANNISTQKLVNELEKAVDTSKDLLKVVESTDDVFKEMAKSVKDSFQVIDKKTTKGLSEFNKALTATNTILEKQQENNEKKKKINTELSKQEKELITLKNKLAKGLSEEVIENEKLRVQIQEQNKQRKIQVKESLGLLDAYQQESARLNNLRKAYKNLAVQNKANTKEGQKLLKTITELDDKLKEVDATVGQNQRSVGKYEDAMKGLNSTIGKLGITAIIVKGIELLTGAFGDSRDGALLMEQAMNNLTATVSVTIGRLTTVAGSIKNLFDNASGFGVLTAMGKSFSVLLNGFDGISEQVQETVKNLNTVTKITQKYNIEIQSLERSISTLNKSQILQTQIAENDTLSFQIRENASKEAVKQAIELGKLQEELARKQLDQQRKTIATQLAAKGVAIDVETVTSKQIITLLKLKNAEGEYVNAKKISSETEQAFTDAFVANQDTQLESNERLADTLEKQSVLYNDLAQANLDIQLDGLDNQKAINERIIASDKETFDKRAETIKDNRKQFEDGFEAQAETLVTLNDRIIISERKRIENSSLLTKSQKEAQLSELNRQQAVLTTGTIEELVNEKNNEVLKDRIIALKVNEKSIIDLLTVIRDYKTGIQDLNETEQDYNDTLNERKQLQDEIEVQERQLSGEIFDAEQESRDKRIKQIKEEIALIKGVTLEKLKLQKELNELTLKNNEVKNNKLAEQDAEADAEAKGKIEARKKLLENSIQIFDSVLSKAREKQNEETDKELDVLDTRIDTVRTAIENGNQGASDSLAELEKQKIEAEQKKEEIRKKEIRDEMLIAGLQAFASNDGNVGKTLGDVSLLIAALNTLPSFFDGTEDTGTVQKPLDSNGGRTAILHDNERVMTAKQNAKLGGISNEDLADLGAMHNSGNLSGGTTIIEANNKELIAEVRNMTKAVKSIPIQSYNYDSKGKYHEQVIQSNNKKETIKVRVNNLFK